MLNVHNLRGVEVAEKLPRHGRVGSEAGKIGNPIFLLGNVAPALGDMPLGFFQVA
jgi:hypothetical protein